VTERIGAKNLTTGDVSLELTHRSGVPETQPVLRPIPRWVVVAGIPVTVVIAVVTAWLLLAYRVTSTELDALRTAGTVGVGFGGTVVLWLAVRRQRSTELDLLQKYEAHSLSERIATHAEHDARERRLTDLYLKAVEQLGSDRAAVRHGALYALERLAQDNPAQRQTVVDVLCAYLRNPYSPPPESGQVCTFGVRRPLLNASAARRQATIRSSPVVRPAPIRSADAEIRQEREVRLAIQRILGRHLRPGDNPERPSTSFWSDLNIDLTGATLIDLDLSHIKVRKADFTDATFIGLTVFYGATFAKSAWFSDASFVGGAWFSGTKFAEDVIFHETRFDDDAWFDDVEFLRDGVFLEVRFGGPKFDKAVFCGRSGF
jgi:hypothetical protein